MKSAETGLCEWFYDASGNVIRKTDANLRNRGQTIWYRYDGFNRLVRTDYPWMSDAVYEYGVPGAANNGAGRLLRRTDESGTAIFSYGKLGEQTGLTRALHRIKPLREDKTASFSYLFDYLGRMERIVYPDGEVLTYGYDNGGQVKSITGVHSGLTSRYVEEVGYDEYGQRKYLRLGNGIETHYTYDANRRWLNSIRTSNSYAQSLQNIAYNFDAVGNVLSLVMH